MTFALLKAIREGREEEACHIINAGACDPRSTADGREKGWRPAQLAASEGLLGVIKCLVQFDAALATAADSEGDTPGHLAALAGHSHVVDFLLSVAPAITFTNHKGRTLAHAAASKGHANLVISLCEQDADIIERRDQLGWTPAHDAANCGCLAVIKYLGRARPSVLSATDKHNKTPLDTARNRGHGPVVAHLEQSSGAAQRMPQRFGGDLTPGTR